MHPLGRRSQDSGRQLLDVLSREDHPRERPRDSLVRCDCVEALENSWDIRLLQAGPSLEKLPLKPGKSVQHHLLHQTLAAPEMMQHRRMGNSDIGCDVL